MSTRPPHPYDTTAYRYPRERLILWLTIGSVLLVIAVTATATVCLSAVFVAAAVLVAYGLNRMHHRELVQKAVPVSPETTPGLHRIASECAAKLQVPPVRLFVVSARQSNAYTFGLSSPRVLVLLAGLLEVMDEEELRYVIGHEMGHVKLGHTWLNSLVGGMAGVPSPFFASALLALAFLWWNRACEYSADRAGLLACGKPEKAISAMVKLAGGVQAVSRAGLEQALQQIEAEDDVWVNVLGELLHTHPMMVRRIEQLRAYAVSSGYHRLQPLVDRNLVYPPSNPPP